MVRIRARGKLDALDEQELAKAYAAIWYTSIANPLYAWREARCIFQISNAIFL
jgi:hypothetical protein